MSNKIKIVLLIISLAILVFLCFYAYKNIAEVKRANSILSKDMENIYNKNKDPIFRVQKVVLYSSAEYEDMSEEQDLQDVSIHQFTDIAVYISNDKELDGSRRSKNLDITLNAENTISEIYIDEISVTSESQLGTKVVGYKSPLDLGKYRNIDFSSNSIYYKVIHNNEDNNVDYKEPVFFTDCSNPLTFGMINKNIVEHCTASNDGTLEFNGKILKNAGIDIDSLRCRITFKVHLKNNLNEEYVCNVSLDNSLSEDGTTIYDGELLRVLSADDVNAKFFKK